MGGCASKSVALQAVEWDGLALQYFSREMKDDKDVVMRAIETKVESFQYASADLRGDKEFVMKAIEEDYGAFEWASDDLRGDKDFVMQAIRRNGHALKHASDDLKGDRDVVMLAIQNSVLGRAFEHASADLRGDKNFVMSAIQNSASGYAFKFASADLQGDKDFVMQAISNYGPVLEYAAASLKRNKQFALEAVRRGYWVKFLDKELQDDPDIRRAEQAAYYGLTAGTERITFEGEIAQKEGVPCYTSFPGKHAKEWNGLTRKAKAGKVSTACVFLTTKDAGLGRHSSPCLCHTIYGKVPADKYVIVLDKKPDISNMEYEKQIADAKKDSEAMNLLFLERNAYKSESEWKKAYEEALEQAEERAKARNYAAPWGCWWFALWKQKVEEARKLQQELVAVFFPAKCGKGKVKWSELADKEKIEQALQDNGLGFSQRAEVAWLEHCGYPVREIDLTTFCQECGLDASTA